ncbi:hypothetical protein PGQ11_005630 [Apiospora arundinis]|uniref:Uncharacterized protein n=1 Tax=Apiospora arundinis TaxID=335852 RepID=A0ABR2JBF1_9PEZI
MCRLLLAGRRVGPTESLAQEVNGHAVLGRDLLALLVLAGGDGDGLEDVARLDVLALVGVGHDARLVLAPALAHLADVAPAVLRLVVAVQVAPGRRPRGRARDAAAAARLDVAEVVEDLLLGVLDGVAAVQDGGGAVVLVGDVVFVVALELGFGPGLGGFLAALENVVDVKVDLGDRGSIYALGESLGLCDVDVAHIHALAIAQGANGRGAEEEEVGSLAELHVC